MQLGDAFDEDQLRRQYLKLAKQYHPDSQSGSVERFQQLGEAYSRLKAEHQGFTLSEEDLEEMFKSQFKQKTQSKQEEQENLYQEDSKAKEHFENWKRQRFTAYDQERHDEFLKNRYNQQKTFYKYAGTATGSQQDISQEEDSQSQFDSQNHFTPRQPYEHRSSGYNAKPYKQAKVGFTHNSRILAFFTSTSYRNKIIDFYYDEIYLQELKQLYSLSGIIICGIVFNIALYYYLQMRKQIKASDRLHEIMDTTTYNSKHKIYVDQKVIFEKQISMEDLLKMYDQQDKFVLSNHLRNKVLKEMRNRQEVNK